MNALLEPFSEYPSLLAATEQQIFRVNTFVIYAAQTIATWNAEGKPVISSLTAPLAIRVNPDVRKLVVVLDITVQGAKLDDAETVVMCPLTRALAGVLPTLFPRLHEVVFRCTNRNNVRPGATYSIGHIRRRGEQVPELRARERAVRASRFIFFVEATVFPRWRNGPDVRKTLEFVQGTPGESESRLPCMLLRVTPDGRRWLIDVAGGGVPPPDMFGGWSSMWKLFDWPMTKLAYD